MCKILLNLDINNFDDSTHINDRESTPQTKQSADV